MKRRVVCRLDFCASEPHFVDHLAPIWHGLPDDRRGKFWCGTGDPANEQAVHRGRTVHGIPTRPGWLPRGSMGMAIVAAIGDLTLNRVPSPRMRFVFTEHGCGISYQGGSASYVGSRRRPQVDLILTPNAWTAEAQRQATPDIRVVALGSEPRLDPWAPGAPAREAYEADRAARERPLVSLSWHWDSEALPETRSALKFYRKRIPDVVEGAPWDVVGHAHPRAWPKCSVIYRHYEIEPVRYFGDILERADLYSMDNSSTLYEFAAAGRPVVVLNCPYYRRDVHHGLRFWDFIPGVEVEGPDEWRGAIELALEDPPELRERREEAVARVFPQHDGHSTDRAVAAILEQLDETVVYGKPVTPVTEHVVRDAAGKKIAGYLVEDEARRHANKIGGYVDPREANPADVV